MKVYDIAVVPESSKIEIFKITVNNLNNITFDHIQEGYEKLLEIYFTINQKFDKNHVLDRRHGAMFDMEIKES